MSTRDLFSDVALAKAAAKDSKISQEWIIGYHRACSLETYVRVYCRHSNGKVFNSEVDLYVKEIFYKEETKSFKKLIGTLKPSGTIDIEMEQSFQKDYFILDGDTFSSDELVMIPMCTEAPNSLTWKCFRRVDVASQVDLDKLA